jgi:hypothetical protein
VCGVATVSHTILVKALLFSDHVTAITSSGRQEVVGAYQGKQPTGPEG